MDEEIKIQIFSYVVENRKNKNVSGKIAYILFFL